MRFSRATPLTALLAALVIPAAASQDKDAKLKEALQVRDVQGGVAGFTGKAFKIQPSGKWEEYTVRGNSVTPLRNGKLSKQDLAALAEEVNKYDPATLKSEGKSKPKANPRVITITYGKKTAKLTLNTDLPSPDADTNEGRFAGLVAAVQEAVKEKKKGKGK